jgi:hypothetical protein
LQTITDLGRKLNKNNTKTRKCADLMFDVKRRKNIWTLQEVKTAPVVLPTNGLKSKYPVRRFMIQMPQHTKHQFQKNVLVDICGTVKIIQAILCRSLTVYAIYPVNKVSVCKNTC